MPYLKKRLRIFAGPNGSGKTTLYRHLVNEKKPLKITVT
jgi:predicted ABC-type ATPase